jgi:hypothetical protein
MGWGNAQGEERDNSQKQEPQTPDAFCALRVSVIRPDGTKVRAALVDLIDPTGKVIQSRNITDGNAEFCDFGFGLYSIRVRSDKPLRDTCETIVRNVKAIYGYSQRFTVTLNLCLYGGDNIIGNSCVAYLRVLSSTGEPLNNVQIHRDNPPTYYTDEHGHLLHGISEGSIPKGEPLNNVQIHRDNHPPFFTDEYGRMQLGIEEGSTAELTLEKEGFQTRKISIECAYVPVYKELSIEMQKK